MNPSEILELIRAGYTKADIDAMLQPAPAEPEAPAAPAEPEAPAAPAEPEAPAAPAGTDQILEALNRMTQAMINNNINQQGFGGSPERTAEQALAEIIAPPGAQRNKLGGN